MLKIKTYPGDTPELIEGRKRFYRKVKVVKCILVLICGVILLTLVILLIRITIHAGIYPQ